jgi:hypothetical protein
MSAGDSPPRLESLGYWFSEAGFPRGGRSGERQYFDLRVETRSYGRIDIVVTDSGGWIRSAQ